MNKTEKWASKARSLINYIAAMSFFEKYPVIQKISVRFENEYDDNDYTRVMEITYLDLGEGDEREAIISLGCSKDDYDRYGIDLWEVSAHMGFPQNYLVYEEDNTEVAFVNPGSSNIDAKVSELSALLLDSLNEYRNGLNKV